MCSFWLSLCVLAPIRMLGAYVNGIADCDETFNYWEAVFLLKGERSYFRIPLQTWEYAPQYSLRSWAFVLPFGLASRVFDFYTLRLLLLSLPCALAESSLVASSKNKKTLLALLASSPGMFFASSSLLPSAVATTLIFAHLSCRLNRHRFAAVLFGVLATTWVGWPFVSAAFVPFFLSEMPGGFLDGIKAGIVCSPVLLIDYLFTGSSPLLNIVKYNAVESSDVLYGTEPFSFYLKNLFLNVNVALFGLLCLKKSAPAWVWLAVISSRPHKEERFTFPAFPSLYLAASEFPVLVPPALILGAARIYAVHSHYSRAQLAVWTKVYEDASGVVCVGSDWYRYPSTFFLNRDSRLGFVESDFSGQLPRLWYSREENGILDAIRAPVHEFFNDKNEQQRDRFSDHCDFYVGETIPIGYELVYQADMIDPAKTPTLRRAFRLPFPWWTFETRPYAFSRNTLVR